jgi:hypothetical protein
MRTAVVSVLLAAAIAHAQRPGESESAELLEKARRAALHYNASLPDFICTQIVHRSEDPRGDNRWIAVDVLTVRLSYFGRIEDYKLTAINGKPSERDFLKVGGQTTTGEFGTMLLLIFHPDSKADFRWKGWSSYRKHRVATYTYRIDKEHSGYTVSYGAVTQGPNTIHPAYHGEFQFDPESGLILHVTQESEMPMGFPIRQSSVNVDYEYTDVGGRPYLLPLRADSTLSTGRYKSRNIVNFKDYRKFQTETTITFDKP